MTDRATFRHPLRLALPWMLALSVGGCGLDEAARRADEAPAPLAEPAGVSPEVAAAALPVEPRLAEPQGTAPPPTDFWERLRSGFALRVPDSLAVDQYRKRFLRSPDDLRRLLQRGAPYLPWILDQVEARDMPTEIALLPAIESSFDPFAYSHGQAAGLWQFIPATGRHFDLAQNWWYDGRRDPVPSTRAALDYLQRLHDRFDSWLLAVAAYNSGEGNVRSAIRRNRARGRPASFEYLSLPRETRAYVPRLVALAQIVAEPERYGVQLPDVDPDARLSTVDLGGQMDLALAAELAGVPLAELYRFNAGFNRWATPPDGPHRLLLPADAAARLSTALETLPPQRRVRWVRHRIRSGESLGTIARRYQTTVAVLKDVNELRSDLIRAGRHLLIPVAQRSLEDYAGSLAAREARRLATGGKRYRVRSGDTLWDIARNEGVRVRDLARWNGMAPADTLRPGQILVLHRPGTATSMQRRVIYEVRRGDSLAAIAARFRVSVRELTRWNDVDSTRPLRPGQRLTLYVDVRKQS
ncbi:LysM peptidoglycan-binding domain-containing protein [Thiohalobacter sp.]|uniref:LysM peptidoglycan-binding domain-containing protein n=1 Tax=Thiohalobacter sp. TaxID=2025948 RepID=UPI00262D91E7|nr:LysM peptidoglycan-binding domain-containing protein [Thiohalobacter sp.]